MEDVSAYLIGSYFVLTIMFLTLRFGNSFMTNTALKQTKGKTPFSKRFSRLLSYKAP